MKGRTAVRFLLALALLLPAACSKERTLLVVDTVSGANFQWFFKRKIVPLAEDYLDMEVEYIVSSGPEMIERMKAWPEGRPEAEVVLVKPRDLAVMIDAGMGLTELTPARVPWSAYIPGLREENVLGRDLELRAVPVWRSRTGLIYNSKYVGTPPGSWKELRRRASGWHERIGLVRPDAKSSGGRRFIYGFLASFGLDLSLPLDSLEADPLWQEAWRELARFSRHVRMPMGEPPFLFQQFKKEQVWMSVYSVDYALWARDQGFLPRELEVAFLEEGMPSGTDAYATVPAGLEGVREWAALGFVNFLLTLDIQRLLLEEMNQYPAIILPPDVLRRHGLPGWEEIRKERIELTGKETIEYIREHAADFMIKAKEEGAE